MEALEKKRPLRDQIRDGMELISRRRLVLIDGSSREAAKPRAKKMTTIKSTLQLRDAMPLGKNRIMIIDRRAGPTSLSLGQPMASRLRSQYQEPRQR
jgi:hypothetical protein